MESLKNKIIFKLGLIGVDLQKMKAFVQNYASYLSDKRKLKEQLKGDTNFPLQRAFPILNEREEEAGNMKGHYFHQDLYVAQKIYHANPDLHLDIGSRTDGFIAHLAVFREVEVLDIRKLKSTVANVRFKQADLMKSEEGLKDYCSSISSLHAIEHFGLGRYGDTIDAHGHQKAIQNIWRILKPGGTFYFSVPFGRQRIEFNAHRVFSLPYLQEILIDFKLISFSYVDDLGDLHTDVPLSDEFIEKSLQFHFSCAIFELQKVANDA